MKWTPQTIVGSAMLLVVTLSTVAWISANPQSTPAWAVMSQLVQIAGRLLGGWS